ncbi:MAG: hypothetical protein K2X35_11235 [Bryobacteraceae bacterium]|nr:hypothetical protein [Bryobacteraceae bacterium]
MRSLLFFAAATLCLGQATPEYVFGFLRAHPERTNIPREQAMEIQKAHMAHLDKMSADGILIGAGPLADSPDLRGVVIFKGIPVEQARAAAAKDPAVLGKRLLVDVFAWPGPPGLGDRVAAKRKEGPDAKWTMNRRALVVYWRTPAWPDTGAPANQKIMQEHVAFGDKLRSGGEVLFMAPLLGSKDFIGVAAFRGSDTAAALKAVADDPFVKNGWVKPQALVWFIADEVF